MKRQSHLILGVILAATPLIAILAIVQSRPIAADEAAASNGAPGLVSYQGYLTDDAGQPISATATLDFGIYAGDRGGATLWKESHSSVNPLSAAVFSDTIRYLQTSVDTGGGAVTMPRQQLAAVPFALQAEQAKAADSAPWTGLVGVPAGFSDDVDDIGGVYGNLIIVAKSGGDYSSIQAALDSISDASASNPYLVKVMPGVYMEKVTMKPYVDIEGSGEGVTKISSAGTAASNSGTVIGASNSELRFLTVENNGGSSQAVAVYSSGADLSLKGVRLVAFDASSGNYGIRAGVGSLTVDKVSVAISGTTTGFGLYMLNGTAIIRDSYFELNNSGTQYGIYNDTAVATIEGVTIQLNGGSTGYGLRNEFSSVEIRDVTVKGSAASFNYGLRNSGSTVLISDLSATLAGGGSGFAYGVYNSSGVLTMTNAVLDVRNAAFDYGVYNSSGNVALANVTAVALGGSFDYGIYNTASSGSYLVTIEQSRMQSSDETIRNDAEFTTRVGNTRLAGAAVNVNGGTVTCAGVYDENYVFSASTCP